MTGLNLPAEGWSPPNAWPLRRHPSPNFLWREVTGTYDAPTGGYAEWLSQRAFGGDATELHQEQWPDHRGRWGDPGKYRAVECSTNW